MDILTKVELEGLMRKEQQWCVSIYLPTHRTGTETQQDPIRLKNLLREAEKHLSAQGVAHAMCKICSSRQASSCRTLISGSIRVMVWRFFSLLTEYAAIVSR